jgi:hypothetical protein
MWNVILFHGCGYAMPADLVKFGDGLELDEAPRNCADAFTGEIMVITNGQ